MSRMTKYSKNSSRSRRTPKSDKSAMADAELVKTQKEAAKYSGVSERTIRRWVKAGMPRTEAGRYIKAMLDFYKDNEGNQPTEAKAKGQLADVEYKDAKAKLMQMELEVKQGKLVPAADIEAGRVNRILAVKRALLGLGRKLAPQLAKIRDERKVQKIINAEVRDMIEAFSG